MFFYLEWIDKRPDKILIVDEIPTCKEINYKETFNIDKKEFIICGNINDKFINYYPPCKLHYKKNQYLSSHLQKCIRRMNDIKSVQTAKHFIDLDLISFLRRLPIIMLEDVTIHSSISIIIWLMIAVGKGFHIKLEMIKWLLGVVYYLSNYKNCTQYSSDDIQESNIDYCLEKKNILYPLRFRKRYGGMKGDMNMIEYYIKLLINDKISIQEDKIPIIKLKMEPLKYKEWIYQANDFHCNRSIISQIRKYHPKIKDERIKELIWIFSSSINKRRFRDDYLDNDIKEWLMIKKYVKYVQKNCIFY
tara:strand:+ start:6167 stop:7078 length:912 start_codon:yes stop_codon:yes gene_type:complete